MTKPKKTKSDEKVDPLQAVCLIDQCLMDTIIGKQILQDTHQKFGNEDKDENMGKFERGTVKTCVKTLPLPNSIQWIIKKRDENGNIIENNWKKVPLALVLMSSFEFKEKLSTTNTEDELLTAVLGDDARNLLKRYRINLVIHQEDNKSKKKTNETPQERQIRLEREASRKDEDYQKKVNFEVKFTIEIRELDKSSGGVNELTQEINKYTKGVLQCCATPYPDPYTTKDGMTTWYPPGHKKNQSVTVKDNEAGLAVLWQTQLNAICRGIRSTQVQAITRTPEFSSPMNMIEEYAKTENHQVIKGGSRIEGERLLVKTMKAHDAKIGDATSKQVYKMMTSMDGNEELK